MKKIKTIKKKGWAIMQKPAGYRNWVLCPTANPWIFTSERLAKQKFVDKRGSTDNKYNTILPVEIIYKL